MHEREAGPPREYDPFDRAVQADPHPVYAWMRAAAPLYRNDRRDFWALTRYGDVRAALRDHGRYSSHCGISLEPDLWGPEASATSLFLAMDPPEHGRYRGLVAGAFTPRRVAQMEPRVRELARERLAIVRGGPRFDFATDYAAALPNDVLCDLLGIPEHDWDLVQHDTDELNQRVDGSDARGPVAEAAAIRLADYLLELARDRRRRPAADLTSHLASVRTDSGPLTEAQIVASLFVLLGAGNESTGKTIGNAWFHGHRLPDVARAGLNGRAEDWARETLRYDSASQMVARIVTSDTVLHGATVPAGSRMVLVHASANRDERAFADPDRFDLDRPAGRVLSYGNGPHRCLGAALADLEMRVALEEVAALVSDYEIDEAGAQRSYSPHQHGFAVLPTAVTWR